MISAGDGRVEDEINELLIQNRTCLPGRGWRDFKKSRQRNSCQEGRKNQTSGLVLRRPSRGHPLH